MQEGTEGANGGPFSVAEETAETTERPATAYYLGMVAKAMSKALGEMAEFETDTATAAADIIDDLRATVEELRRAVRAPGDGRRGLEALRAVRETLNLVYHTRAAEEGKAQPVRRDAVRDGLAALIERKRGQLARMAETVTSHTGIPPGHYPDPAATLPHPVTAARRRVERDTAALVHAWDVM